MTSADYRMTSKGDLVFIYVSNSEHVAEVIGKTMAGKKLVLETVLKSGRRVQFNRNYSRCQICNQDLAIGKRCLF